MSIDVYQTVTDRIIDMLEAGTVPWRQPWAGGGVRYPRNLRTGREYRGVNVFLLAVTAWRRGYESAYWLTFRQARERGGSVRKGEKSTPVIFWKPHEVEDKRTGESKIVPCLRHYRVFSAKQCDGIDIPDPIEHQPLDFQPIEAARTIADGYEGGPAVTHGGGSAHYLPGEDTVTMPAPERFASSEDYYSTLFHELIHSAGHPSRLDRLQETPPGPFGSAPYGREELVAEMGAAFLCGRAGISAATAENSAAYLQGWLKRLCGDKRLVVHAAGAAQRAADWILGRRGENGA